MIQPNECYESLEPREMGRTLRVLAVFPADAHQLKKSQVAVASRGKATMFSLERLLDQSRFRRVIL